MKTILFILPMLLILSCDQQEKAEIDALRKEVMDVHDEVMPRMGEMIKIRKALMEKAQESVDSTTLLNLSNNIDIAHEEMMQWMRNYEPGFTGSNDEVRKYLLEQKTAIQQVREKMIGSLNSGADALKGIDQ